MSDPQTWTFGELQAALGNVHNVAEEKRPAFQARLKNFHRLGFPNGFTSSKGKTSRYDVGSVIQLALALELTQLGLSPDSIVKIVGENEVLLHNAVLMAARGLVRWWLEHDKPAEERDELLQVYLFTHPHALASLTPLADMTPEWSARDSLWFGTFAGLEQAFERSQRSYTSLAVINLTTILKQVLTFTPEAPNFSKMLDLINEIIAWASVEHSREDTEYFQNKLADWMGVTREWLSENFLSDANPLSLVDIRSVEAANVNPKA